MESEKVAFSLGFEKNEDGEYLLWSDQYTTEKYNFGEDTELFYDRINELKKHINYLGRSLWAIQTEVEMKYGNTDYSEELKELVCQIRSHTWKLEYFCWNSKSQYI